MLNKLFCATTLPVTTVIRAGVDRLGQIVLAMNSYAVDGLVEFARACTVNAAIAELCQRLHYGSLQGHDCVETIPLCSANVMPVVINNASNAIALLTKRGPSNCVVMHPDMFAYIGMDVYNLSASVIHVTDWMRKDEILVAYCGVTGTDGGFGVYADGGGYKLVEHGPRDYNYYHLFRFETPSPLDAQRVKLN